MRDQYDAEFFAEFHEAFADAIDRGIGCVAGLFRGRRAPAAKDAARHGPGLA